MHAVARLFETTTEQGEAAGTLGFSRSISELAQDPAFRSRLQQMGYTILEQAQVPEGSLSETHLSMQPPPSPDHLRGPIADYITGTPHDDGVVFYDNRLAAPTQPLDNTAPVIASRF